MALALKLGLLEQDFWPRLRDFVYIQVWSSRYSGQVSGFRFFFKPLPRELARMAAKVKIPCLICGDLIAPIRVCNGGSGPRYLALACPQQVKFCSQDQRVTEEYDVIRYHLQAYHLGLEIPRERLKLCPECGANLNEHGKPFPLQYPDLVADCAGRHWKLKF